MSAKKYLRDRFLFKRITIIHLAIENSKIYVKKIIIVALYYVYWVIRSYFIWMCNPAAWKWMIFLPEFDVYKNWMPNVQVSIEVIPGVNI